MASTDDERKALQGVRSGGEFLWGAQRYAILSGDELEAWATFDGADGPVPVVASKRVGRGSVIYAGTLLGLGASHDARGLAVLLRRTAAAAGVQPAGSAHGGEPGVVHVDVLRDEQQRARFAVIVNRSQSEQVVRLQQSASIRAFPARDHRP